MLNDYFECRSASPFNEAALVSAVAAVTGVCTALSLHGYTKGRTQYRIKV
jgi:hypothetical protein